MKLIVQPDDGVVPLALAIHKARKSVDLPIFRLDHVEIDRAIKAAVKRGIPVRTLIAHTNTGGGKSLRKLEQRLLATGATVSRTADDLSRYHNKSIVIDRSALYVLAFNFTHLDIDRSRSLGIFTKNKKLVQEALKLFEADFDRQPYTPGLKTFVVSPFNSRPELAALLKGARKQLLIYDTKVTDNAMIKILQERAKAGVEIRILGGLEKGGSNMQVEKFPGTLHLRAIVQDGRKAFVGSQSLRRLELEGRREVGVIVTDSKVVKQIARIFEADWALTASGKEAAKAEKKDEEEAAKAGKKDEEVAAKAEKKDEEVAAKA